MPKKKKRWSGCCNPDRHNQVNISHKSPCGVKNMWFILLRESETKNCSIFTPEQLAMLLCNRKTFQHSGNVELDFLNDVFFSFMVNATVMQTQIIFAGPKALLASQPFAEERCDAGFVPSHTHSPPLPFPWSWGAILGRLVMQNSARRHGWPRSRAALRVHKYLLARDAARGASAGTLPRERDPGAQSSRHPHPCANIFCITIHTDGFSQEALVAFSSSLRSNQTQRVKKPI